MYEKAKYLVSGCTRPLDSDLQRFFNTARQECPAATLPEDYQVRWIGGNAENTAHILQHIRTGDKTGTVSVPDVIERTGQPQTNVGDAIILINFDGSPAMLVRINNVEVVAYGDIDIRHTSLDGPRVRDIEVWKPLHVRYFDMLLAPFGMACDDSTRIAFESFELVYSP